MKVILVMATTLDGKIAKDKDHFTDWTCPEDKKFFMTKTKESGCLIMGRSTYSTICKPLPHRLNIIMTKSPDEHENLPGSLEFTDKTPKEIIHDLKQKNFQSVVICGGCQINSLFFNDKLIDEIYLSIEPKIFGKGISLFDCIDHEVDLQLLELKNLGENAALMHYKIIYP